MSDTNQTDPLPPEPNMPVVDQPQVDHIDPPVLATQDPATPMGAPGEPVVNTAPLPRGATTTPQGVAGELRGFSDSLHTLSNHVENSDKLSAHSFIAHLQRKFAKLIEAVEGPKEDEAAETTNEEERKPYHDNPVEG